eukprot:TRINITY_DN4438_c0_g1_i2.p1 TRINITY_DN4438_c0_g1~~TRINITY_DN4438_c0_g1_i2.p1  ORF type:complete len:438 (-),score=55.01 TRINITY_DN4438_c0_g1_i2:31-1344(-)
MLSFRMQFLSFTIILLVLIVYYSCIAKNMMMASSHHSLLPIPSPPPLSSSSPSSFVSLEMHETTIAQYHHHLSLLNSTVHMLKEKIHAYEKNIQILQDETERLEMQSLYGPMYPHDLSLFRRHARNNTVWLFSVNRGMLPFVYNMLCSLARINTALIDNVIFHALDKETKVELENHRHQQREFFNTSSPYLPTWGNSTGYGILYSQAYSSPISIPRVHYGDAGYTHIMKQRPLLFLSILRAMKMDLMFSDVDVVYMDDPFKHVLHPVVSGEADVSMSIDQRSWLDPDAPPSYPNGLPKYCGGFFHARSNARTIALYERLHSYLEQYPLQNDQSAWMVIIQDYPVRLVGRLSRGLATIKGINADVHARDRQLLPALDRSKDNDTISIHVLDQLQYINAYAFLRLGESNYEDMIEHLEGLEAPVIKHGNFWEKEKAFKE